jgi:hypothetical protein
LLLAAAAVVEEILIYLQDQQMVQVDLAVRVAEQLHSIIILQHHLRVLEHPAKDILVV